MLYPVVHPAKCPNFATFLVYLMRGNIKYKQCIALLKIAARILKVLILEFFFIVVVVLVLFSQSGRYCLCTNVSNSQLRGGTAIYSTGIEPPTF